MGKKLIVLMKHTDDPTDPGLRGFPYHPDQYIDFESWEETEDRIEIDLARPRIPRPHRNFSSTSTPE
ncbi:hypothetical protein QYE77_14875 (plasmid) [Thermanaerothrix sp. 4228-RoL]|uniref:Uncharacterized protein n=1 Tax=Thermanaerothrix solaris TaxID=3058434 RepID=A0ABU3NRU2_9CHLR|nr:hypothetical protein [Thermanaerothrix sp. 4228-RoL]MDT8899546.1 hypothetical protein [Thermanaerothrix sp. 4228-RoL]